MRLTHIEFSSNIGDLSTRQYGRIVDGWVSMIGLDQTQYGTHTMRRTKPSLIYKKLGIQEHANYCWVIESLKVLSDT